MARNHKSLHYRMIDIGVDPKSFWEQWLNTKDDEFFAVLQLQIMLYFGELAKVIRSSNIESYRFEFSCNGSRLDLVLFHGNGGITIIEAKGNGDVRNIVAGIGQLCLYESQIIGKFKGSRHGAYVNKILVAPIAHDLDKCVLIQDACSLAGVRFIPLESHKTAMEYGRRSIHELYGQEVVTH